VSALHLQLKRRVAGPTGASRWVESEGPVNGFAVVNSAVPVARCLNDRNLGRAQGARRASGLLGWYPVRPW